MSKVVVFAHVTLDGVMQAPAREDEDRRGGFPHGGWANPFADPVITRLASQIMATSSAVLLGRRTYEDLQSWPHQAGSHFAQTLNEAHKYVVSKTLTEPLSWANSRLLSRDPVGAVSELKQQPGKDLVVLGSGELVQALMRHRLIDQYVLMIHPLILGAGRRLFNDGDLSTGLCLLNVKSSATGIVIATYQSMDADTGACAR
ncbi:MAG TPA: dihydrofolate reductase family protein [Polyangia bacterium]|nr:dihydrofolate reductase family protein [Polyangia bacterium]